MKDVCNSLRVSVPNWKDEAAFSALLEFLGEYRDCVQQIAFFSSDFHPPQPLEKAAEHAAILRDRIRRGKEAGFSCGVNVLSTVGHHPERPDECLRGPWRRMTNIDGAANEAVFCPADEDYRREYVAPLYRAYCAAGPDFIWVDDDLRYGHHPTGNGCFCDGCLALFNGTYGYDFTRETLKAALTRAENAVLRHRWLSHQSEKIASLLGFIRETVNACDDTVTLGFMTGERYFEGYDFPLWANALSGNGKHQIMWRPGGGAYTDRPFSGITEKAAQIGRQCAPLPPFVASVQAEIENFPYRVLQKSPRSTALEALLHTAVGCTGAALNVLPDAGEPVEVMRGHFEALRAAVPFERLLRETFRRAPAVGIFDGWHPHGQAALDAGFLTGWGGFGGVWEELFSLGLPECFDLEAACCCLLAGKAPRAYEKEELLRILSMGVCMDAEALAELNAMGYGELTGFAVGETFPDDSVEVYADHPLNEGFAGARRLCPQVFVGGSSAALVPAPGAQTLCYLTDHRGRVKADCSMGLYRNRLGGTVCAASHYARCGFGDTLKSRQMKRLFRLLSGGRLPFAPEGCVRLNVFARRTGRGEAIALLNPNLDTLKNVSARVNASGEPLFCTLENGERFFLTPEKTADGQAVVTLPDLPPYTMALIAPD